MSKNSERILKDTHYITSDFGMRHPFVNGVQRKDLKQTLHDGTDYGTNNKKINCYSGYSGKVIDVSFNKSGGNCVIVEYNNGFRGHYRHLDKQLVSVGQIVSADTIVGLVGNTGNSSDIHLHYSIQNTKTRVYEDYEKWIEPVVEQQKKENFLTSKGYLTMGDKGSNVEKLCAFMRKTFPSYSPANILGNYYGPILTKSIKEFQSRTGLKLDGNVGPLTLAKLKTFGFKE